MMSRLLSVVAAACLANPALSAQEPVPTKESVVSDGGASIIIAPSESGKTLYGYSIQTGHWDGVAVTNPDDARSLPCVGTGVGYVVVGKRIYAFSAETGRWAVLELPEAAEPKMSVGARLRVDLGSKIYMFSAKTGKWAIIDLAVDKE
jgi:hypothetical protein